MMEVIDKLSGAARNLIPPVDGAANSHVRKWRIWVAAATFLNAVGLSVHIALACGFAAPFYPGFAQAGEYAQVQIQMAAVKDDLQKRRVKELSSLILDTKEKQCAATGLAKRLYYDALNNLRAEYFDLVKREFPEAPCSDFQ